MFVRLFHRWVHPVRFTNAVACGIAAFFLVVLPACLPETPAPTLAVPTATATITPTQTNTIIWFPATATFTPMPTREILPTVDLRPGLGAGRVPLDGSRRNHCFTRTDRPAQDCQS